MFISGAAIAIVLIIGAFIAMPMIEQKKSFRPFCEELGAILKPQTKLYGFAPDETISAVIPFYTGQYFTPIEKESELAELAKRSRSDVPDESGQTGSEILVVVLEKRSGLQDFNLVQKYFPYKRVERTNQEFNHIWVLSNKHSAP